MLFSRKKLEHGISTKFQESNRLLKQGEANVKRTQETIDSATKKNTEAVASVVEQTLKLNTLKVDKEAFLVQQGVKPNNFDSFVDGEVWTKLRTASP